MKKVIILVLYLGVLVSFTQAQNEKFKALFMYNFTKYVEWPTSLKSGNFVFGTDVGQGTGLDINNQMVDLLKGGLATTV